MKKTLFPLLFFLWHIQVFCAIGYNWSGSQVIDGVKYQFSYGQYTSGYVYEATVIGSTEELPSNVTLESFPATVRLSSSNGMFAESITVTGEWTIVGISSNAFKGRTGLISMCIPGTVKSIGSNAFADCDGMMEVHSYIENPFAISSNTFSNYDFMLYVPKGTKAKYEATDGWKNFGDNIVEMDGTEGDAAPYAVYDNGTLTFYCDNQRSSRQGTTYDLNEGYNEPAWMKNAESITTAMFDASFANARPSSTNSWFYQCHNLSTLQGLENLNTSSVTNMYSMFRECISLTTLDLSSFNTANVTTMSSMFQHCRKLTSVNLSSFNTDKLVDTNCMFFDCSNLTSLDLSNFKTANAKYIFSMFASCGSLTSITFGSNFVTTDAMSCYDMFKNSGNLNTVTFTGDIPSCINSKFFEGVGTAAAPATLDVPEQYRSHYAAKFSNSQFFGGYFTLGGEEPTPEIVRNVVMEEATGTWCGWCIRGFVAMKQAKEQFGDRFIGIAVHGGDMMDIGSYYNLGLNGYPSCLIDRDGEEYDPSYLHIVRQRMDMAPTAGVSVKGEWNADKTKVTATSETQFLADGNGYRVAYTLVADGLKGTSSRWYQQNYYSGNSSTDPDLQYYCEQDNPITDMVYNNVMVSSSYNSSGQNLATSFGGSVKKGDKKTNSYTLSLPTTSELAAAIDKSQVYVVAIVTNPDGTIANAAKAKVATGKKGDVNCDGVVDVADISAVISVMAGLETDVVSVHADVNADGSVDVADISAIITIMAGTNYGRVLQIWLDDGKMNTVSLSEEPHTTFSNGNLTITTKKNSITYPLEKVLRYTYANAAEGFNSNQAMSFSADDEPSARSTVAAQTNTTSKDFMSVFLNNGNYSKFYLRDVTELFPSKEDANGEMHSDYDYQHITTNYENFVCSIYDIDSITFTKYDEEKAEQNLAAAMPGIFSILADCGNLADAENCIQQFNNLEGVEKAWSDGHQLYVSIKGWEVMPFHFSHDMEEEKEEEETLSRNLNQLMQKIPQLNTALASSGSELKAAIINQQSNDKRAKYYENKFYQPLIDKLKKCNIKETKYIDNPTLNTYSEDIFKYDLVLLITHGVYTNFDGIDYGKKLHSLVTREEICNIPKTADEDNDEKERKDTAKKFIGTIETVRNQFNKNGKKATSDHIRINWADEKRNDGGEPDESDTWVCYISITEKFIEECADSCFKNPNSILFNTACESLKGGFFSKYSDSLADKFFKRGLGLYFGYTGKNSIGKEAGPTMFESLLKGYSLEKAFDNLPERLRNQGSPIPYSRLLGFFNPAAPEFNNNAFIIRTKTIPIEKSYRYDNYVEVEGLATSLEPNSIQYGFIYDTDKDLSNPHEATDLQIMSSNTNGNVYFIGNTDIAPEKTYYYCAYTYDGINYNYGDTLSFTLFPAKISKVELARTEYHRDDNTPNFIYYNVSAILNDVNDVKEWGIYYECSNGIIEKAFNNVETEQTMNMYYSFPDTGGENVSIDFNSYVLQYTDEVGAYVKKQDPSTGELITIYGDKFSFSLLYDTKPSLYFSNPNIVSTKVIGTSGGYTNYETKISYDLKVVGTIWIEYTVSDNTWHKIINNTKWYPEYDGHGVFTDEISYWNNSNLECSYWDILYLRNSKTITSNYINFSGEGTITNIWVSSEPAFSRMAEARGMEEDNVGTMDYVSISKRESNNNSPIISTKGEKIPYKEGYIGSY